MLITADTKDFTKLAADLARAGATIQQPINLELREVAKAIRATARDTVPKQTGRTQRSITYSSKAKGLHYEIGPKWFVGRFLEFGTVNMQARPFMQPAAERHLTDLADKVAKQAADNTFTGRPGSVSSLL